MQVRFLLWIGLILATQIFSLPDASAYIPSARTILNRLARTTGKGVYQVDQEVEFRAEGESLVLRERWIAENGDSLRLSMSGAKGSTDAWKLDLVYKDGKRWYRDSHGRLKSSRQSAEFIEPYLYFRSGRGLLESLIRQNILPTNLTSLQVKTKSLNGTPYQYDSFVRLARVGGFISYAFGRPTPPQAGNLNPGFWVEQDSFLIRRIRFPSQAQLEADKYVFAAAGLRIPRERVLTWNDHSVQIRILSVKRLTHPVNAKKMLRPSSLPGVSKGSGIKLPDLTQVKEFYQRYR